MRRSIPWKKLLILTWACALAFGLTFQTTQAEAVHSTCYSQCKAACKGSGGCGGAFRSGCSCAWFCGDDSEGTSTCVL